MATRTSSTTHSYGRKRPSQSTGFAVHKKTPQVVRDTHFRPVPSCWGSDPFHLDVGTVLDAASLATIQQQQKLTFHLNGDMGGVNNTDYQVMVAKGMEEDFDATKDASENPAFLYILGDCVYFNGQLTHYYAQFYQPYEFYHAPIFAVPGNHDGENLTAATAGGPDGGPGAVAGTTLDGFIKAFCQKTPEKQVESQDSSRTAMTQPNVYWTLLTPLATFVGLYSNVPEGGDIRSPQIEWFTRELKGAPKDKPLLVTLHHPIYSADDHHSGSTHMRDLLTQCGNQAGRHPDLVLAGHVHNYQRLTKKTGSDQIPYLVVGAGGYSNLHHIKKSDQGEALIPPVDFVDHNETVTLERYSADHHGFMRMEITPAKITGRYYAVPQPHDPPGAVRQLVDYFEYDWKQHQYMRNAYQVPTPTGEPDPASAATGSHGRSTGKHRAAHG